MKIGGSEDYNGTFESFYISIKLLVVHLAVVELFLFQDQVSRVSITLSREGYSFR